MEFALYFTLIAIAAYFLSAWILERIESAYGKRLPYRNVIFFAIIFALAYAGLAIIGPATGPPAAPQGQPQGLPGELDRSP